MTLLLVVLITGCSDPAPSAQEGQVKKVDEAASTSPLTTTTATAQPSASATVAPKDDSSAAVTAVPTAFAQLPQLQGEATVVMMVKGKRIAIAVNGQEAPVTAGNFVDLVSQGVYDGTSFHRVVRTPSPFVAQGGDPQSKDKAVPEQLLGTGNYVDPKTQEPRFIPLEILPEGATQPIYSQTLKVAKVQEPPKLKHRRGAVAMARSNQPDSASAQFYFTLADVSFLDGDYAVFGSVIEGMDVVDQIQQGDRIESAKVTKGLEKSEALARLLTQPQ
ncbi:MAG: peptidylprolyl isomerase [Acaryochloridaceae cyanobacterium CSU_5_19]|nr:peptidylprolyl isomerase [Acaryochloridaceae cyanobacterium CSU_5_19]